MKKYLVIVDLDDTLIKVNSGKLLIREAMGRKLMRRRDLLRSLWFSVLYKFNLAHSLRLVKKMTSWLEGQEEDLLIDLSAHISNSAIRDKLNSEVLREIERHRSNNGHIVLLSAALPYICHDVGKQLNMDDIICSSLEVVDGYLTGQSVGPLVFGREKGKRLKEYCLENNYEIENAYCYADSFSDLQMLKLVGHPVAVNPDRRLGNYAKKHGWAVIRG